MTLADIFSQSEGKHHRHNRPGEVHLVRSDQGWTTTQVPPARVRVVLAQRQPGVRVSGAAVAAEVLPTQPFGQVAA
jgi:hypothetical protein